MTSWITLVGDKKSTGSGKVSLEPKPKEKEEQEIDYSLDKITGALLYFIYVMTHSISK